MGRRRRDHDARRPRRGQQRRAFQPARIAAAGTAVHQALAARLDRAAPHGWRSTPTPRIACCPRSTRSPSRPSASRRKPTSISDCVRSTGSSIAPRTTMGCATSSRGCGRWRSCWRTATSRKPRRRCGRRRMRLREALERGASDEEIKRLMDQLRAALDKFLQALAEEMRKNPQMARPLDPNSMRQLRSQDLRSMLDRMERLARSGARDAARRCSISSSRCSRTCRWRGRAARATMTTRCSRRSTSSAT